MIVAEVRLSGAGGDDQRVVLGDLLKPVETPAHLLGLHVDPFHETELHRHVPVLAQHLAGGGGDLALRQDAGRHLVEQGLEEVMGGSRYQRHLDVSTLEGFRREQTTKTGTNYHNTMLAHISIVAGTSGLMPTRRSVSLSSAPFEYTAPCSWAALRSRPGRRWPPPPRPSGRHPPCSR